MNAECKIICLEQQHRTYDRFVVRSVLRVGAWMTLTNLGELNTADVFDFHARASGRRRSGATTSPLAC